MFLPMKFKSIILLLFSIWFLLPKSSFAFEGLDEFQKNTSISPLKKNNIAAVMDIADLDLEDDDVDDLLKKSTLLLPISLKCVFHVHSDLLTDRCKPHSSIASITQIKHKLPESLCIFRI